MDVSVDKSRKYCESGKVVEIVLTVSRPGIVTCDFFDPAVSDDEIPGIVILNLAERQRIDEESLEDMSNSGSSSHNAVFVPLCREE
jgi:hypothetical protein